MWLLVERCPLCAEPHGLQKLVPLPEWWHHYTYRGRCPATGRPYEVKF